jgi:class 3 adenylate cyclase
MSGTEDTLLAAVVFASIAAVLGVMMLVGGARTRANLGIGGAFVLVGPIYPLALHLAGEVGDGPELLARFTALLEALGVCATATYVSGLAATSHARPERVRRVNAAVTGICGVAGVLAVIGLVSPGTLFNDVVLNVFDSDAPSLLGFWLVVPLLCVMTALFMYAYFLLFRGELDPGERTRAICAFVASPLLVGSQLGTPSSMLVLGVAAMMTTFYGLYRNAIVQGERSAFLSRFLSPQVAEQVRADGLTTVMQPGELDLTVVACDLRGFTSYAEGVPSQAVIDLLGEYYEAVGRAVAEVDGTIKDYAGDGVLVLVGAPLARRDHAVAALSLARRLHDVTRPVIDRWSTGPHPLGIGVGVASGRVTVGLIGSDARMEYTAVGTPVNLAARLCSAAAAGETLVDERLAAAAGTVGLVAQDPMRLKGFEAEVAVFAAPNTVAP